MQLASIGFLAGVLICQALADLPSKEWSLLLVVIIPLAIAIPKLRLLLLIVIGFLYSVFIAHDKVAGQISSALEGKNLLLNGIVSSLPSQTPERTRFQLDVIDLSELTDAGTQTLKDSYPALPKRIQLTWYRTAPAILVGQRWELLVRLKRPHGFSNPGGFDFEAWLFQHDIHATGYVRDHPSTPVRNRLLGVDDGWLTRLHRLRAKLSDSLKEQLPESNVAGLLAALVVGDRQSISKLQWKVLTNTGTNHLMAISGLHIGLVAGLVFFLAGQLWRRLPHVPLYFSTPKAAALCSIVAALVYAALAGFTLPTQRALIMVVVTMLAISTGRPIIPGKVLSAALFAVLIFDPTAVISGSFWLSFGAVAIIFYTMTGRLPASGWWWKWGRIQWVIAVGLAPLLLFWFQQVPLVSPIANLLAVPVVSLITVPFSLLGGLSLLLWEDLAFPALWLAALSLDLLWPLLDGFSQLENLLWFAPQPPIWTLAPALIGMLWLLAPRGIPARWAGVFWILPMVFYSKAPLENGMARLTVLDVGHGLAVVVQTASHVLVYDTGPRYSRQFDAGHAVVVPYLKSQGIEKIDRLILSHNDIDHTGGYISIAREMNVTHVMHSTNVPLQLSDTEICEAGRQWNWDGVSFRVIHPQPEFNDEIDNNMSCVVQITTQSDKLLLTGDIERKVEAQLVKFFSHNDDNLRADILVVPHHGSRSSSSTQFVQMVKPDFALISAGYRNRYGLPKADIVERYQAQGASVLDTNWAGAIELTLGSDMPKRPERYRANHQRYWSRVIDQSKYSNHQD